MACKKTFLLVTNDVTTTDAVATGIKEHENLELTGVFATLDKLHTHLSHARVPAVLVDIDPNPQRNLQSLGALIGQYGATRFVVTSETSHDDLLLEAMQIGARYFLKKNTLSRDLPQILQRLVPDAAGEVGSHISVMSVSGGCGATSLAVNLANELRLATDQSALLIDFDTHYGAMAPYLGITGEYSLADLLSHRGRIDSVLVRTTAVVHSEKLEVLLSPASVNFSRPAPLDCSLIQDTLTACRSTYGYTVIDAPRVCMDLAATIAQNSCLTLIVLQMTVKDLLLLRRTLRALEEREVEKHHCLIVANRFRKTRHMIGLDEAEKIADGIPLVTVANDFRSALLGVNYGKPLAEVAPRSAMRRQIQRIATIAKEAGTDSLMQGVK